MQARTDTGHTSRLGYAITTLGVVIALLLVLVYRSYKSYEQSNALTLHTEEVHSALQTMRADLYRAESLVRAYYLSDRTVYLERSRDASNAAATTLERVRRLTQDDALQRARVPLLRRAFERRMQLRDQTVSLMTAGGIQAVRAEYARGAPSLDEIDALITAMSDEERRLFSERKVASDASVRQTMASLGMLLALGLFGFIGLGYRLRSELARREAQEALLHEAARLAEAHGRALTIFNEERDADVMLARLFAMFAEALSMPVAAFYAADPFSEMLSLTASHGVEHELPRRYKAGEGLIGSALTRTGAFTLSVATRGFAVDAALARLSPEGIIICAARTQERCWGVLVVASVERAFAKRVTDVEQICTQLGIALENIERIERQRLLGEQLRERGEEITEKNAELERANELKSEFLATMSHELRTPLNAVIGFSESLRDGLAGPVLPEQKEFLGIIFEAGQHLLALINDVLDLSKIEAGHVEIEPEDIDVASLVEASAALMKERAMRARVKLTASHDPALVSFAGDARKIKQIVYNLVSNAVKFTPEGGEVSLRIEPADGRTIASSGVTLTHPLDASGGSRYVEIRVTDSGIGISADDQKRLFQPFQQLEGALTRRHGGTGLGLSLVDKLALMHGGAVGLSSAVGVGSRFSVFLPLLVGDHVSERGPREPEGRVTRASSAPRRALIVEDDPSARRLIADELSKEGVTCILATTAEQGLDLAKRHPPDVIILDLLLPAMDGFGFLEALHKEEVLRRVPVVITSVIADENRGISLGAFRVLQKPVSKEALLEAIDAITTEGALRGTVLVVDDDPQAVKLVAQQLERRFERVLRAYGGPEAIAIALDQHPDVIVLDLMMPDVSGFDVVERLKATPATARIPIAILTAKSLTSAERAKLQTHVEVIMQKSEFNHGRFLNEVKRAMFSSRDAR